MTLMMMHLNDPVPDVRDFRTDVRPELVEILEKCLAKDRNDRYLSAVEMAAELRRSLAYIGGQPTSTGLKDGSKAQPAATVVESQPISPPTSQPRPQPVVQTVVEPVPGTASQSQSPPPPRTFPLAILHRINRSHPVDICG